MNSNKEELLEKAKHWFRATVIENHIHNSKKLINPKQFNINPFLATYLANFLNGDTSPESIAKALIYPRVLGNSITTSFGQNIQKFTNEVLSAFGSTTSGIDIEFIDKIDGNKKYCQLKAGPNTINKDDVVTVANHFKGVINLAKTNNLRISLDDMIVGLIYGEASQLSSHYKKISSQYHFPVYAAQEFWHRLTGDVDFYSDLVTAITSVIHNTDYSKELIQIIKTLSKNPEIITLSNKNLISSK